MDAKPNLIAPLDNATEIVSFGQMTTKIALSLVLLIVGFFVLDHFVLQMNAGVFLAKRMIGLINLLAIWR